MHTFSINRLFTLIIKYIYTQLMSRDTSRTITKSKIELTMIKANGQSLTFVTGGSTPEAPGVLELL